jgi:hypothetical protein
MAGKINGPCKKNRTSLAELVLSLSKELISIRPAVAHRRQLKGQNIPSKILNSDRKIPSVSPFQRGVLCFVLLALEPRFPL